MRWALLDALPPDHARAVVQQARRRKFRRNEVVFHEGDPGDAMHLVAGGHLAVRVTTPLGERAAVRVVGPGEFVGELALLAPGPRNATVAALEAAETLVLGREQLDQLRKTNPTIDNVLIQALVQEVRRLSAQLLEAMYVPAPSRLAHRLADLAATYPADPAGRVVIPVTQDDLAGLCGTTRSTVNQILGRLADEGIVDVRRGRVAVLDAAQLSERI